VVDPGQASVAKAGIGSSKLCIAIGRQIDGVKGLVVQGEREGERNGDDCIIPVIAGVHRPRHDRTSDLGYGDLAR